MLPSPEGYRRVLANEEWVGFGEGDDGDVRRRVAFRAAAAPVAIKIDCVIAASKKDEAEQDAGNHGARHATPATFSGRAIVGEKQRSDKQAGNLWGRQLKVESV